MTYDVKGYKLIQEDELKELESLGLVYEHIKTGARVLVLSNKDDNKVFSIGFRTPPQDSTGVPHIVEHTVLCGSRNFPAKDPFIELAKGSLNTFLNAMTYPDKTIYPVASCNAKDFANLMHVYMDAVFFPNIYNKEEIFKQEGWHYELEEAGDPLTYNGVVYNEMKGAFSSPEQILFRTIQQAMLPDTPYGVESGGDPKHIPELTYEAFLDFHRRYYHASNSYIYLYGDMDVRERLAWMDENYLSQFEREEVNSQIKMQIPFREMEEIVQDYSIGEEEEEAGKTYLSYNTVIETSLDENLYLAFQIIEYALLSAPGAPLKQALLDAGIGKDVLSSYDNGIQQPIFSIITKNADECQKEAFVNKIKETLTAIIEKGIDARALEGAINYFEFKYREADFGQYPKGLMYGIQILDSWLYDDAKPFIHVCQDQTFEFLKGRIGTGYYEELIKTYLIENSHCGLVIVRPKKGLTTKVETELKEQLEAYKNSLSQTDIENIIKGTEALHLYEMTPATKEENERIPLLERSDIGKKCQPLYNEEKEIGDVKVLHHNLYTNKIAYLRFNFDVTKYVAAGPYLGLLSTMLGYVDTRNYSFLELSNEINIHTGGLVSDLNVYNKKGNAGDFVAMFELKGKALYEKIDKLLAIMEEILTNTNLTDEKRLKEILAETRSRMEMKMVSKGHVTAVDRSLSYFSESALFEELVGGVSYYNFIVDLDTNFEEKKTELIETLKKWMQVIFRKDNLFVSYTADEKGYQILNDVLPSWLEILNGKELDAPLEKLVLEQKNEGFKTPGQVQYVARSGNFMKDGAAYTGALRVLKVILSYDYLWNNIRVKGGAYGCMCGFSMNGNGYFTSYRDPNLRETNEVYKGVEAYLESFTVEERDMTKYVIGAISSLDTPLNPSAKGSRSLGAYLCQVTEEDLQREREEVLATDMEAIRSTAKVVKGVLADGNICVVGNENKIEENKDLFKKIANLC